MAEEDKTTSTNQKNQAEQWELLQDHLAEAASKPSGQATSKLSRSPSETYFWGYVLETEAIRRKQMDIIIGERIRSRRIECRWSQQDLADKLEVTRAQVSSWESARVSVYFGDVPRLASVLRVPPLWFLGSHVVFDDPILNALNQMDETAREAVISQIEFYQNRGRR